MSKLTMSFVILIVALTLTGCARTTVYKPGTPAYVVQADLEDCKYEAAKYASPYTQVGHSLGAGLGEVFRERKLIEGCMLRKGYSFK